MGPLIEVLETGLLSLLVDNKRHNRERFGVPRGGCADWLSYTLANRLVGNSDGAGAIEATLLPPKLRFCEDIAFAVCGGICTPSLLREGAFVPVEMNATAFARAGDILSFSPLERGCRIYISVYGGLAGLRNEALKKGTRLFTEVSRNGVLPEKRIYAPPPVPDGMTTLRVIRGIQNEQFSEAGRSSFFEGVYTVSAQSNRMGIRLTGDRVAFAEGCDGNIISEAVLPGDIQITSEGSPILMLADCQTTGGYTKIGHVITADIPLAAQLRPGDRLRFSPVSIDEAQKILRGMHADLSRKIKKAVQGYRMSVFVNGVCYNVEIEEIS